MLFSFLSETELVVGNVASLNNCGILQRMSICRQSLPLSVDRDTDTIRMRTNHVYVDFVFV